MALPLSLSVSSSSGGGVEEEGDKTKARRRSEGCCALLNLCVREPADTADTRTKPRSHEIVVVQFRAVTRHASLFRAVSERATR